MVSGYSFGRLLDYPVEMLELLVLQGGHNFGLQIVGRVWIQKFSGAATTGAARRLVMNLKFKKFENRIQLGARILSNGNRLHPA